MTACPQLSETGAIAQARYVCALGALASVIAIPGAVPITHCGPGCATKQIHALSGISGYQGGEVPVPSTNLGTREVVFGGAETLDALITATWERIEADLLVVLAGCIPGLIGDDLDAVVRAQRRQGVPVVLAETLGYQGTNFTGHEQVARAIIEQFVGEDDGPRNPRRVNVWALVPYQNPFWRGDLEEIHRVLSGIGLEVSILFGHSSAGIADWQAIPRAGINLVLSPWVGRELARTLERKYGQTTLHQPALPIGAAATSALLRQIAALAGLPAEPVEAFITAEERRYYLYLRDFNAFYAGCSSQYRLPSHLLVAGESAYALAITRFMVGQLGLEPARIVITENPPDSAQETIRAAFRDLGDGLSTEITFAADGEQIHRLLRETNLTGAFPILFATTWDGELARQLDAPLIEIGYPATDEVVLSRTYLGYRGALALIERIYTTVVRASTAA